jgi:hypothetical protein
MASAERCTARTVRLIRRTMATVSATAIATELSAVATSRRTADSACSAAAAFRTAACDDWATPSASISSATICRKGCSFSDWMAAKVPNWPRSAAGSSSVSTSSTYSARAAAKLSIASWSTMNGS